MEKQDNQTDLEELLSEAPETAPEPRDSSPETVDGKGDINPETPSEAPHQDDETEGSQLVPRAGLIDERKKRQGLEKERDELRKKLEELTAQPSQPQQQQQPPQVPDFYDDPEGFMRHQNQQVQRAMFENRALISQELMREKHQDYDEVEEVFAQAAQNNPALAVQMMQSPNPAKFAYDMGRKLRIMAQIGDDPTAFESQLEAKFREKYGITDDGQPAQPAAQTPAPVARAPTSLAAVPSAPAKRDNKGRFAPASLSEILDD